MLGPDARLRRRDGFKLTDARMQPREVLSEIHYCVLCHERDKDSCSKGLHEAGRPSSREGHASTRSASSWTAARSTRRSPRCTRCGRTGDAVGALALVVIDNPMCPGTGHRICNDCMKSCIYQKQEPVNIPQIETGVLTDVLRLPWGVEIYGLLTRWNPLNVRRPYALPYNGKNVLVVGLGPAGLHAGALPGERRLRRRRHRRLEDRAAARRISSGSETRRRARSATGARSTGSSTSACSKASAASRSTASRCAGTRTS